MALLNTSCKLQQTRQDITNEIEQKNEKKENNRKQIIKFDTISKLW